MQSKSAYESDFAAVDTSQPPNEKRRWFALSVKTRYEKVVSQILVNKGLETFLPLYQRRHQYVRRVREFNLPLFPGYLFCRLDPAARLPVLTTPGVVGMVGAGRIPVPVEDSEISSLQRAAAANVSMIPHPYWQSGQMGRITAGALAGLEGIVVSAKPPVRLILSVCLLQRSVLVEIDSESVAPVEKSRDTTRFHLGSDQG